MEQKTACSHLLESLSDYIDGELSAILCEELERHLNECPNCQIVVNTTRKTVELYHTTQIAGVPDEVRVRLFKRLELADYLQDKGESVK